MSRDATAAVVIVVAIIGVILWCDWRLLTDLAQSDERELRYFNRNTWALIIVLSFPIGPVLYLRYAKGPS